MKIIVRLFAGLQMYAPADKTAGAPFDLEMPEGSILGDLLTRLVIPTKQSRVTFVNGRSHTGDFLLKDKDEVGIFPPVGGG